MEENINMPEGFFDEESYLVDKEFANPFQEEHHGNEVQSHPFDDGYSTGYIRYIIQERSVIILSCVVTETRQQG